MKNEVENMRSVMVFSPEHTEEETNARWEAWWKHNKASAADDFDVPKLEEPKRMGVEVVQ